MPKTRTIAIAFLSLVAFCEICVTRAEPPRVPIDAVLEADRYLLLVLPKDEALLACKFALAEQIPVEREAAIRMRRGWLLYVQSEYAEARADFEWVMQHFPNDSQARCDRAICLLHEGQAKLAVREWEELIARDPNFVKSYDSLAQVYLLANRFDLAISVATRGLAREPANPTLLYTRASAYFKLHDFDACLRDVDQALSKESLDFSSPLPNLYAVRGGALLAKRQYEAAARNLYLAIRLDPKPPYKTALCQALVNLRKNDLALALAQELDQIPGARSDLETMRACAVAFFKGHKYEKAVEYLQLWIAKAPSDCLGHEVAGLTALAQNEYESAREHMEQALKLNSRAEGALGGMAVMYAFDPDPDRRDNSRALNYAKQLIEATKDHPARGFAISAFVHLADDNATAAIDAFRKSLEVPNEVSSERREAVERNLKLLEQTPAAPKLEELRVDARLFVL